MPPDENMNQPADPGQQADPSDPKKRKKRRGKNAKSLTERLAAYANNHAPPILDEVPDPVATDGVVDSHLSEEGFLWLHWKSGSVKYRPSNVFLPVRKSLDESRDIVEDQRKTFSPAHARNQSSPAKMPTMPKFLEDNILERTAAELITYLRSEACPYNSVVKQALYDAIFQYSILAIESKAAADGESRKSKSNFSDKFDSICQLPTKDRELALKESESLLEVLYEALMEDLKSQPSTRALMQSLHNRVSELTTMLREERSQHKREIEVVSETIEKNKAEGNAKMAALEKRLTAQFTILFSDQSRKLQEAERVRDAALGPGFDLEKERERLAKEYLNRSVESDRKVMQLESQLQAYRRVNADLQSSNSTNEALNKQIAMLAAEIEGLKASRADATDKAKKQQETIDGWDEEKKRLTRERCEIERKFKALEVEVLSLKGNLASTSSSLKDMTNEFAEVKEDLISSRDALAENLAMHEAALLGNKTALGTIHFQSVVDKLRIDIVILAGEVVVKTIAQLETMDFGEIEAYVRALNAPLDRNRSLNDLARVFANAMVNLEYLHADEEKYNGFRKLLSPERCYDAFDLILSRASELRFDRNGLTHTVPENFNYKNIDDVIETCVPVRQREISKVAFEAFDDCMEQDDRNTLQHIFSVAGRRRLRMYMIDRARREQALNVALGDAEAAFFAREAAAPAPNVPAPNVN